MASGQTIDQLVDNLVSSLLSYENLTAAQQQEAIGLSTILTFRVAVFTPEQADKFESVLIKGGLHAASLVANIFAFKDMTDMLGSLRKARDHFVVLEFKGQKNSPSQHDSEQLANLKAKIAKLEKADAEKKKPITRRKSEAPATVPGNAYTRDMLGQPGVKKGSGTTPGPKVRK
ncbi:MAG: hypothetical protein WC759_03300 [Candidatus Micrarchaeia archaeon]|jgi:hypothetical protein